MRIVFRLSVLITALAGILSLVWLTSLNRGLSQEIEKLEAELGRMPIDDVNRVHFVEIEKPYVPSEVAEHIERVWQFRCYLPPGYDFIRFNGSGRVAKNGCYFTGGFGSSWSSPQAEAIRKRLTISLQKKHDRWKLFYSLGGTSGTDSLNRLSSKVLEEGLVVQKLVMSEQGPRSFDRTTILPLLRMFDPSTAKNKEVAGQTVTTYQGGLIVLCPKSREPEFNQLSQGKTPMDFDPSSVATEAGDE